MSARPLTIARDHARRFLVRRHLLDPPRSLPARSASVLAVVARIGSLQFDPLEVPGARNHDLVLFARIAGYARAHCDRLLYATPEKRRLFEGYNKSLNILPTSELPYFRSAWTNAAARHGAGVLARHPEVARAILARLSSEGPLSSSAFAEHDAKIVWGWGKSSAGQAVLMALFEAGEIAIAKRDGNRRYYDLVARVFPKALLAKRVSAAESMRHRLLSRFRGVGLMGTVAGAELVLATGTAQERAHIVASLVEERVLTPVEIDGVKGTRYALTEELPMLHATATPAPASATLAHEVTFVAPLDPFVWDRRLLTSLFDFDYRWEVYVPAAKRTHGYYVLPLLFGDRLVGRIEPRLVRATGVLEILLLSFVPAFAPREEPGFVDALLRTVEAYRVFVGATRVKWPSNARRTIGPRRRVIAEA